MEKLKTIVHNMDRKLVALREAYEIRYISTKYGIGKHHVKEAIARVGRSRKKIVAELLRMQNEPYSDIKISPNTKS